MRELMYDIENKEANEADEDGALILSWRNSKPNLNENEIISMVS